MIKTVSMRYLENYGYLFAHYWAIKKILIELYKRRCVIHCPCSLVCCKIKLMQVTPAYLAILNRQYDALCALLEAGADVNEASQGNSLLHTALFLGAFPAHQAECRRMVEAVLARSPDLSMKGKDYPCIIWVCETGLLLGPHMPSSRFVRRSRLHGPAFGGRLGLGVGS